MKTVKGLNIQQLPVRTIEELAVISIKGEKNLSVKLLDEQHKKLKLIAFKTGTSMSEIVRSFLVQFIDQYKKENVVDYQECTED